jgi:hypothetical protein
LIEGLRESRFGGFRRLLASYVFFWAMARDVGRLPLLRFKSLRKNPQKSSNSPSTELMSRFFDV